MKETLICLIGPTAVGKTEVAVKLAKRIGAEIISCDSMQIYKNVDIAVSKPGSKQRKAVPHHLISIIKPSQEYNAARFRRSAEKLIRDIHRRKKIPLIVGGTGLYLRALLDGIFTGPGRNAALRNKFVRQAGRYGPARLFKELKKVDPRAAENIHPNDLRRIIRALEVYRLTGTPISELQAQKSGIRGRYQVYIFGLRRNRNGLYARIEKRVERMFRQGLVAEIKRVSQGRVSRTARSLLGYKEIKGFLDGEYSREEAGELLKKNTRRYAKRQMSWFRGEKGVRWIDVGEKDSATDVCERIIRGIRSGLPGQAGQ